MNSPRLPKMLLLTAILCLGSLTGGCRSIEGTLYDRLVTEIPGPVLSTNTTLTTNLVISAATTNALTGEVTPERIDQVVSPVITYTRGEPTYVTNLVARHGVEAGIAATGAIPLPWMGLVGLALGWAYQFYASVKNRNVAGAIVQSVEAGRRALKETPEGQELEAKLVAALERHQLKAGVWPQVQALLKKYLD